MAETSPKRIKSVENVVDILELIKREELKPSEVADRLGFAKSTVHYYLTTLEEHGYIINDESGLRLGLRFIDLADAAVDTSEIYQMGWEQTNRLAEETDSVARLVVLEAGHGVVIYQSRGEPVEITGRRRRLPVHASACGKAILAHLPEHEVEHILSQCGMEAYTERTITEPSELWEELATVREHGIAVEDEEFREGRRSIAAPIIDLSSNEALGAVGLEGPSESVSLPDSRQKAKRFVKNQPNLVRRTAKLIQNTLNEQAD